MIKSKEDYRLYIKADEFALGAKNGMLEKIKNIFFPRYILNFQRLLRKVEYYHNCKNTIFGKIFFKLLYMKYTRLSLKLGFSIPLNVFGPGLSIAHYGTIVISPAASIGSNCRLHIDVNIGASNGSSKAPQIGDNCYIAPGAKIYGDIYIASNVAISANSVVNKSVIESNILIAGVPAKKINEFNINKIVLFSTEAIKKEIKRNKLLNCEEQNKIINSD